MMLYGLSKKCEWLSPAPRTECAGLTRDCSLIDKESVNCRMEAQYGNQQQKDMIPLMLEEGYNARGWLGMMLGVRLWYGFFGTVLASEGAFEAKMEELCRELGDRAKIAMAAETCDVPAPLPGVKRI